MKKIIKAAIAGLSLISLAAVAAPTLNNHKGFTSSYQKKLTANLKSPLYPATDISVVNAAYDSIYVVVPNTPIHDMVGPSSMPDHIRNWNGAFSTAIMLEDVYGGVYFNRVVCPRALLVVYGGIGNYNVVVDNEYCN